MTVRIHSEVLSAMIEHARREYPLECCGLLAGQGEVIDSVRPTRNAKASSAEFFVPVEELFAFFQGLRRGGREHLGIYHSHPGTDAFPSSRDVAEFHYPGVSYWIISLKNRAVDVRCFRWEGEGFKEVGFELTEPQP